MLTFKYKVEFELDDAKEVDSHTFLMVMGKPFCTLVDARDIRSNISHEAREYFAKNKQITSIRYAQAIVVNNLHTRILANF